MDCPKRVEELKAYTRLSIPKLANKIGIKTPQTFYDISAGKHGFSKELAEKILAIYPELSYEWLLQGSGKMIQGSDHKTRHELARTERLKENYDATEERPHIPFEVAAGSIGVLADSGSIETFEKRPVIPSFPFYDFTMTVSGRSMEPQFESGDIIAVRALDDRSAVRWGEVYVVASNDGLALKRVYQEDEESLRLVSFNPEYHPYLIPQTEDVRLFRVVGLIRAF